MASTTPTSYDDWDWNNRYAPTTSRSSFYLRLHQQPARARLCSFKEENDTIDRRPVDPPPIVEILNEKLEASELLESSSFFIRASLVHPHTEIPEGSQYPTYVEVTTPTGISATTGEVVQTPERLKLMDESVGALTIFAKLSVRMPGIFRLKFTLYAVSDLGMQSLTYTVSETFEVFSPKLFTGMRESTALTRHLAMQGVKVKLRSDTTAGRSNASRRLGARKEREASSKSTTPVPKVTSSSSHEPISNHSTTAQKLSPSKSSGLASKRKKSGRSYFDTPLAPPKPPVHSHSLPGPERPSMPAHLPQFQSAPGPAQPPGRSLFWDSTMNDRFPGSREVEHRDLYNWNKSAEDYPYKRNTSALGRDDGMVILPEFNPLAMGPLPKTDLSAFSLSSRSNLDGSSAGPSRISRRLSDRPVLSPIPDSSSSSIRSTRPELPSTESTSSFASSLDQNVAFSPTEVSSSAASASTSTSGLTSVSSTSRSQSPFLPPFSSLEVTIGPPGGDDGIAVLPSPGLTVLPSLARILTASSHPSTTSSLITIGTLPSPSIPTILPPFRGLKDPP